MSVSRKHNRFHPFHTATVQKKLRRDADRLQKLSGVVSVVDAEAISMFFFVPSFRTRGSLLKRASKGNSTKADSM